MDDWMVPLMSLCEERWKQRGFLPQKLSATTRTAEKILPISKICRITLSLERNIKDSDSRNPHWRCRSPHRTQIQLPFNRTSLYGITTLTNYSPIENIFLFLKAGVVWDFERSSGLKKRGEEWILLDWFLLNTRCF